MRGSAILCEAPLLRVRSTGHEGQVQLGCSSSVRARRKQELVSSPVRRTLPLGTSEAAARPGGGLASQSSSAEAHTVTSSGLGPWRASRGSGRRKTLVTGALHRRQGSGPAWRTRRGKVRVTMQKVLGGTLSANQWRD